MQTHGVYRGLPRRSPSGRRRAPHHHFISLISLISLMQAPRRRNTHTTVAIKQAKHYPCGTSSPEPNHTAACKPTGYIVTHQLVRQVRQVRQVRHKRHAPATCTPPLPSSKQSFTPTVNLPIALPHGNSARCIPLLFAIPCRRRL